MGVLIQSLIKRRDRYVQSKRWAFHTILQKAAKKRILLAVLAYASLNH